MIGEPLVGPQRLEDVVERLRAELEPDPRVLSMRTRVERRMKRYAGNFGGRRRAVVKRRHVVAEPRSRAGDHRRFVRSGMDLFAVAPGTEPRVDIDPADPLAALAEFT